MEEYTTGRRLRSCEWVLLVFFAYIAGISPAFHSRSDYRAVPFIVAAVVFAIIFALAYAEERIARVGFSITRDWVAQALVLVAYREMDWFTPKVPDHHFDNVWIVWDRVLLQRLGLRDAIESMGVVLPGLLELSYLLVYAVGPFTVAMLYFYGRRQWVGWVLCVYVIGTVAAYGLFPFFPSSPPRVVFPGSDLPAVDTAIRRLNLHLVGGYGIHSSVFPSAHVSSAFSAAWAILLFLPDKKALGWGLAVYATLVAIATVYGRYHFAFDSVGGLGVSIGAAVLTAVLSRRVRKTIAVR